MPAAPFISFEGGEGSGKSTQIKRLKEYLEACGQQVVATREPGGSQLGDKIRSIIIDPDSKICPVAEAMLFAAGRAQHVDELILPCVRANKWVLCDRFLDSSIAYQGLALGLGSHWVASLNHASLQGHLPDRVYLLDVEPKIGLARARKRQKGKLDRQEARGEAFHEKVRQCYLEMAQRQPDRYKVIDSSLQIDKIWEIIKEDIQPWLKRDS